MRYIQSLTGVHRSDEEQVGQRAVDLAVISEKGQQVPLSFVINNEMFEEFVTQNGLQKRVGEALLGNPQRTYETIRELFINAKFPEELIAEIVEGYEGLSIDPESPITKMVEKGETPSVNVIISPNHFVPSENREGIILNVHGLEEILLALKECWACLFTPEMQRHRQEIGVTAGNLNVGIIVERMERGEITSECWSVTNSATEELTVKAYYGLPDLNGSIEKDEFRITREYLKPVYQSVAIQTTMLSRDENGKLDKVPLGVRGEEQKLNDREIAEIARLTKRTTQFLDKQTMCLFNIHGERMSVLLCNTLPITKGSVKLEGFEAEERIEETAPVEGETPQEVVEEEVTQEESPPEVVEEEPTTPEETPAEVVEEEPPIEEVPTESVEEEVSEPVEEESATEEESIFAGLPQKDESANEEKHTDYEVTPETEEQEETPHEKPVETEEEKAYVEANVLPEELESPTPEETYQEVATEKKPEEYSVEPEEANPPITEYVEEEAPPQEEQVQEVAPVEEINEESSPTENIQEEAPVEETYEAPPAEHVEDNLQENETPTEEPFQEPVVEEEQPTQTTGRTLDQAYDNVLAALIQRYEARFKKTAPANVIDLFEELNSEIIIPHDTEIGKLIRIYGAGAERTPEDEQSILSIIDDFLEHIV